MHTVSEGHWICYAEIVEWRGSWTQNIHIEASWVRLDNPWNGIVWIHVTGGHLWGRRITNIQSPALPLFQAQVSLLAEVADSVAPNMSLCSITEKAEVCFPGLKLKWGGSYPMQEPPHGYHGAVASLKRSFCALWLRCINPEYRLPFSVAKQRTPMS